METNKNNSGENKSTGTQNPVAGLDLNGLINDPKILEILKHLLSGGGAMAGSYFIWIKPLQDKIEALTLKAAEQDKRIKELEEEVESLTEDGEKGEQGKLDGGKEYFELDRTSRKKEHTRKYRV